MAINLANKLDKNMDSIHEKGNVNEKHGWTGRKQY